MDRHVQRAGVLHVSFGALSFLAVGLILVVMGGPIGLLNLDNAPTIVDLIWGSLLLYHFLLAIPCMVAGWGLLKLRGWSRILTIILSALNLLSIPLGTLLGMYSLWVMMAEATEPLFESRQRFG